MDDKFGYEQMKSVIDSKVIEEQQKEKQRRIEQEQYENERANADQIQYDYVRSETIKEKDKSLNDLNSKFDKKYAAVNPQPLEQNYSSLLDSVQDKEYRINKQQINEKLDREKVQIQNEINNRSINDSFLRELSMGFALIQQEPTHIEEKVVEPTLTDKIKEKAKKALPYIVAGTIAIGTIAGGYSVFTQPEITSSNNNFHPNSVEDVIEHRDEQVESDITTHPEHIIDDNSYEDKVEEAQNEKDYMVYYDENGNTIVYDQNSQEDRKKVISIENQENNYVESATKGGRQ